MRSLGIALAIAVLAGASTMSGAEAIEFAVPVGISAGHGKVGPARSIVWSQVKTMIDESNRSRAVDGLDPSIDAEIIDPAKVRALLDAMAGMPVASLAPVEGRFVNLNYAGLMVGTAQPTSAASFARVDRLMLDRAAGKRADISTDVAIDCGRAVSNATAARQAGARFDADVRGAETQAASPRALSHLRTKRFRAAQAWRLNARHAVACKPTDTQAAADLREAEAAVKAWLTAPQGGGMPAN